MPISAVTELRRMAAPVPEPQSIAFDGAHLWVGSRATRRIVEIDPATWSAREETTAPGIPWGMTFARGELVVVYGVGDDDDRVVQRYVPGRGFAGAPVRAPDGTGSQLSWDGDLLTISQWYNRRILGVDANGAVERTVQAPHGICGHVVVDGRFYCVTTDDEDAGDYWLTRIDARGDEVHADDIALIGFPTRALTFDGENFWTNHRAANEIVCFAPPADV